MSGTATSPASSGRTRRSVRRPQTSQWIPVTGPDAEGAVSQVGAPPGANPGAPAPGGPVSFRDFLGPIRAGTPDKPATAVPLPAPPSTSEVIDEPDPETPSDEPLATPARPRRRLAVPRLLDRRLALVAAVVIGLAGGIGANAVSGLVRDAGGRSDGPPPTPEQCAAIQAAWTSSAASQVGMTADDPATLRIGFLGARDALDGVAAPSGVAADWDLVTTYLGTVAAAVEPVDPADGAAITAAVGTAIAGLDTPAVTAASARVTAYLKGGCVG